MQVNNKILQNLWSWSIRVKKTLESLWLNENEVNIYLASLSIGPSSASDLWKHVWLNRSTTQYTCQCLTHKRIMTMIEHGNKYIFSAEEPEKLLYLLSREMSAINTKKESVEKIMWDLKNIAYNFWDIPKVKYYQWVQWIIDILEDALTEKDNIYGVLRVTNEINPEIRHYVLTEYIKKKEKFPNKTYWIINDNLETREYGKLDEQMKRITMLVPEDLFPFKACMQIYGNKVSFFSFVKSNLSGIIVEDSHIKQTQFSVFKMAWEMAKIYKINEKYGNINL